MRRCYTARARTFKKRETSAKIMCQRMRRVVSPPIIQHQTQSSHGDHGGHAKRIQLFRRWPQLSHRLQERSLHLDEAGLLA
jgi:hypothetical protein